MKKLLPVADKLFEKWTIGLDRATQHATWSSIAEQCELDGIPVGNGLQLKNCVRNWINRAQVRTKNSSGYYYMTSSTTTEFILAVYFVRLKSI